jgi:hypothetical protein
MQPCASDESSAYESSRFRYNAVSRGDLFVVAVLIMLAHAVDGVLEPRLTNVHAITRL